MKTQGHREFNLESKLHIYKT